jgi:PPOX class probable F420-dependent enzyme
VPDSQSATESSYQQGAAEGYFGPLGSAKYMRLTTFKPDGLAVSSSVQGIAEGDKAYFRTWAQSDTAKRLRRIDEVQVIACTAAGFAIGVPLDAVARRVSADKAAWVAGKLARKHPFRQRFLIPLVRLTQRRQMAYYELLTYEAAATQI